MAGLEKLPTPTTTSEFRAMVETVREDSWGTSVRLQEIAAELRLDLGAYLRKQPDVGRAGSLIIVKRVTRPLLAAANLHNAVAQNVLQSYNLYLERVVNRAKAPRAHGRAFDPNK